METIEILLPPDHYISMIEPFKTEGLFTNAIYHKEEPGCGFTKYALSDYPKHLICIEPNVPVIIDKEEGHNEKHPENEIRGVHRAVSVDQVKAYLLSDKPIKKIITTPEGFITKVKKAFEDPDIPYNMYKDFFMLFDECERIITDVNYRGNIAGPIDDFFKFDYKALVSATTLPFSDERFNTFKRYIIKPGYDYAKQITVIETDNVLASFKKEVEKLDSKNICTFFNSTKGIVALINFMGIGDESKIYCADASVVEFLKHGLTNATSVFDSKELKRYNFFTSRYFSAVDIILDHQPDVIMISDVIRAVHSILDPQTEIVQIPGRFRNKTKSITHITNFNSELTSMNKEEALFYLKGSFTTYRGFVDDYNKATNPGAMKTLKKAIEQSDEHKFHTDGNVNMFMVDNFIHEERVKGYYQKSDHLKAAYRDQKLHFNPTFLNDVFMVGDKEIDQLYKSTTKKEQHQIVLSLFAKWMPRGGEYAFAPDNLLSELITKHPIIWEAYILTDRKSVEETNFSKTALKALIKGEKRKAILRGISTEIYHHFSARNWYSDDEIINKLTTIFSKAGLTEKISASKILKFFEGKRSMRNGLHVYVLTKELLKNNQSKNN